MVRGPRPFNARDDDGSGEFPFQPAVIVTVSGGNLKPVFGITGVDPVIHFERVLHVSLLWKKKAMLKPTMLYSRASRLPEFGREFPQKNDLNSVLVKKPRKVVNAKKKK